MMFASSRHVAPEKAHNELVAQPHSDLESPVAEAETVAEQIRSDEEPLGPPGKPFNRRSPFFIGMTGAAGVAITVGVVKLVLVASHALVLIGVALFIAIGLEPAVSWLVVRGLRRGLAVAVVVIALLASIVGFFLALITPLVDQAAQFIAQSPLYLQKLRDHSSWLGQLNDRFGLQQRIQNTFSGRNPAIMEGVLGAGKAILGTLTDLVVVLILTIYFVADFPRIRSALYRLVPGSRRPRAILIGDQIFAKVGSYLLGNVLISVIAGLATFIWLSIFGVPYAVLLSILVALLDLIPIVGSTAAGVLVSLTALTVSLPVCLATVAFFIAYRLLEDYLLVPKIIGRVVKVPALVTVVSVVLGGVLLGVVGALVAIPIAAAILLIVREITFPRLDQI
jgi:predicted PurR-regulated permease PerM